MLGIIALLERILHSVKYGIGVAVNATLNMFRAGNNKFMWGTLGGIAVGALLGTSVPIIGNIIGAFVGGVVGSTVSYFLSQ